MESYPELFAKHNFYLCPLANQISEKRIVSQVAHLPILRLQTEDQDSLQFLFLTTFGRWVHEPSWSLPYLRIFSGDREKLEN